MPAPAHSSGDVICRRVSITGRVQGVWYRGWTVEQALSRGLDGWVRNRRDGSVEALFAGPAALVEQLIKACHEGPPAAAVATVISEPDRPPDWPGFRQLPTE
jgi:acylphosphatase